MIEDKDILIKFERAFQKELEAQKQLYESKIKLLESGFESTKHLLNEELKNKIRWKEEEVKALYDIKSTQDKEKLKEYYEKELASTREWYEEEIERRIKEHERNLGAQHEKELASTRGWYEKEIEKRIKEVNEYYENRLKETENWHAANLKEKLNELKNGYEEMLKAKADEIEALKKNFKNQEAALTEFIEEQRNMYETLFKPLKIIRKIKNKIKKILELEADNKGNQAHKAFSEAQGTDEAERKIENAVKSADTEKAPKVSVILPVYNVGRYLRQSLDSLINQTLKDIEIICTDDGSTDESGSILDEYSSKDSRIKVIHKSNKGTGAARNDGLRLAKGECIGFVDPDDWVKPEMFERLYREIKEKNLDIAMCMPDGWDEKNRINAPFPYFVEDNFKNVPVNKVFNRRDLSPFQYPMCVWNKLYTKKLFDDNHIDFAEGLDFEDHKVIFGSLLTAERMSFIPDKLYVYRYNRTGSVLTDNNRRLIDHIKIFDVVENLMKETNTFGGLREDFLNYKIHNILYYYGMIKEEYKKDYYEAMKKSLEATKLNEAEYNELCTKYPELKNIL